MGLSGMQHRIGRPAVIVGARCGDEGHKTATQRCDVTPRRLVLLLTLGACASHPKPVLHVGAVPVCAGCLEPYPQVRWSMSVDEVGTRRVLLPSVVIYPSQGDCQTAGASLGNPDAYAVCRPWGLSDAE